jgi:polysaccharide biosynthesis/export protein
VLMQGQVGQQGQLTLTGSEMTLIRALARAGYTAMAGDDIEVRRPKSGTMNAVTGAQDLEILKFKRRELDVNNALDIPLRNGDIVWVSKAQTFFIEGFVKQTGSFTWEPTMTVRKAISLAGGISERGTYRGLQIARQVDAKTGKPCANLPDVIGETAAEGCVYKKFKVNENTRVMAGDTVIVNQRVW